MRLISLNVYGGRLIQSLLDFVKEQSAITDIFCFQEVFDGPAGVEVKGHEGVTVELLQNFRI